MKTFVSTARAVRRGHLKVAHHRQYTGQNTLAGVPIFEDVPYLIRRTNSGRWVRYQGFAG